jgi:hypothetical protein
MTRCIVKIQSIKVKVAQKVSLLVVSLDIFAGMSLSLVNNAQVRRRIGSHGVDGYDSHGKDSHYVGGY